MTDPKKHDSRAREFAAARNGGWEPHDEDTPAEYCETFDFDPAEVTADDIAFWADEFAEYEEREGR